VAARNGEGWRWMTGRAKAQKQANMPHKKRRRRRRRKTGSRRRRK